MQIQNTKRFKPYWLNMKEATKDPSYFYALAGIVKLPNTQRPQSWLYKMSLFVREKRVTLLEKNNETMGTFKE